jgi:hypothetical protein
MKAFVKSYKYNLFGEYTVIAEEGLFYKFLNDDKAVYVPAYGIDSINGFDPTIINKAEHNENNKIDIRSSRYNLSGHYSVRAPRRNLFYKFTKDGKVTYVPEFDADAIERFDPNKINKPEPSGGARKTRKGRKGSRRSRAKGTRRYRRA